MANRFEDFISITNSFAILRPSHFSGPTTIDALTNLAVMYKADVDQDQVVAKYQLYTRMFRESLGDIEDAPKTMEEVCEFLKTTALDQAFLNIATLVKTAMTIPVSSAGVERSFS